MFWWGVLQASLFLSVCVPFPSMSLAGEAVQSKHRFNAPENMRLGSTAKARQTPLLDRRKQACFLLISPGQWVAGAAPAGLALPAGGASDREPITCTVWSLFWCGLGWVTTITHHFLAWTLWFIGSWTWPPGGNKRWGWEGSKWAVIDSSASYAKSNWKSPGHWRGGEGKHLGRRQQILTKVRDCFGNLNSGCSQPFSPHRPPAWKNWTRYVIEVIGSSVFFLNIKLQYWI